MQEDQSNEPRTSKATWMVYVDGSSTSKSTRGGIVLVTPKGNELEYAVKFKFRVTNNKAESETLLTGCNSLVPSKLSM